MFTTVTRKHQTKAGRVIGGVGTAAAVTMLRDALLSTALYVCLGCAALVLGAHYQHREAQEMCADNNCDAHTTAALPVTVGRAAVGTVVTPESEAILEVSMSAVSHGQMETGSTSRHRVRVTRQPPQTFRCCGRMCSTHHTPEICGVRTKDSESRNWAIVLRPDGKQMPLTRVSASRGTATTEKVLTRILPNDWSNI